MQTCFCVIAKKATPGNVKTRLTPWLSSQEAAHLAEAFLADTWHMLQGIADTKVILAVSETSDEHVALTHRENIWKQGFGDLGEKLQRVAQRALSSEKYQAVVLLGTDSPGLPKTFITEALAALEFSDAVFGPCEDGGFYLLALKRIPKRLFEGISWSQATTAAETIQKLKHHAFKVHMLPVWFDVDLPQDLMKLKELIESGQITAPATQNFLTHCSRL